ncbi:MIT domain-containing protein 1-like [Rhagoletis pomonella]|uniref:MIT domain-containing protein 1-like n=1 Tax=Rhagoletis pomonella TaxID=28610 RepID=UPI00177DE2F1|nr:MIT domain-containing protein 1-like [Rhagoletis pomonella]
MNAKDILMRAVQCDQAGRILEAQNLYQDGIQILMDLVSDENDVAKKKVFYERIKEYIDRAEQIKERVQNHVIRGELVTNIPIDEDSAGNSYESLFGKYLNAEVKEVLLEEPYLHEKYHFQNLITFLELLVKNCRHLKYVRVVTKTDNKASENQKTILEQIRTDMARRNVSLTYKFEDTLHDRKIVLSNGYIIKIGRGLHFFKATNPLFSLGLCDYDFRKCLQTDVDIWRTKNFVA